MKTISWIAMLTGVGLMVSVDWKIAVGCMLFVMGNWLDDKEGEI